MIENLLLVFVCEMTYGTTDKISTNIGLTLK